MTADAIKTEIFFHSFMKSFLIISTKYNPIIPLNVAPGTSSDGMKIQEARTPVLNLNFFFLNLIFFSKIKKSLAIKEGRVKLNGKVTKEDEILIQGQLIEHETHRHEPPVLNKEIKIIHQEKELIVVDKPSSITIHPSGRYRHNSMVFILAKERGFNRLYRIILFILFLIFFIIIFFILFLLIYLFIYYLFIILFLFIFFIILFINLFIFFFFHLFFILFFYFFIFSLFFSLSQIG